MVVVCLASLMLVMAVRWGRDLWGRSQLAASADAFFHHLLLARSEAIKRRRLVVLCVREGEACSAQGAWSNGWLLFVDDDGDGILGSADIVLARSAALTTLIRASGNQPVARYIAFDGYGHTRLVSGAFQAGTITFCQVRATPGSSRAIIIAGNGRPRQTWGSVASCG